MSEGVYATGYTNSNADVALGAQITSQYTTGLLIGSTSSSLNGNNAIVIRNSGGTDVSYLTASGSATFVGKTTTGALELEPYSSVPGTFTMYGFNNSTAQIQLNQDGSAYFAGQNAVFRDTFPSATTYIESGNSDVNEYGRIFMSAQ